jgi:hypothetical protein
MTEPFVFAGYHRATTQGHLNDACDANQSDNQACLARFPFPSNTSYRQPGGRAVQRLYIIIFALVALVGCARVETNVSRFHTMADVAPTATYYVMPTTEQERSLEWQQYANAVSQEMMARGYRPASFSSADLLVFLHFGIDGGQTTTSALPMYGQTGGGTSYSSGTLYGTSGYRATPYSGTYSGTTYTPPTYGVTGYIPVQKTTYSRALKINIYDNKRSTPEKLVPKFEATATSRGEQSSLSEVMPYMIKSVFQDFPGKSGESKSVVLQIKR